MSTLSRVLLVIAAVAVAAGLVPVSAEAQEKEALTYYQDVAPIIQNHCQGCHRPSGSNLFGLLAPMPLMSYEDTRPWARSIAMKVRSREMPPWFADEPKGVFKNERGLTDVEISTIVRWVEAGAPAGDRADAPPAPASVETTNDGWMLGTPDFVVKLPEPYVVPDDAFNVNLALDVRIPDELLPEDTWVRGWELRTGTDGPGVHHMLCVRAAGGRRGLDGHDRIGRPVRRAAELPCRGRRVWGATRRLGPATGEGVGRQLQHALQQGARSWNVVHEPARDRLLCREATGDAQGHHRHHRQQRVRDSAERRETTMSAWPGR